MLSHSISDVKNRLYVGLETRFYLQSRLERRRHRVVWNYTFIEFRPLGYRFAGTLFFSTYAILPL